MEEEDHSSSNAMVQSESEESESESEVSSDGWTVIDGPKSSSSSSRPTRIDGDEEPFVDDASICDATASEESAKRSASVRIGEQPGGARQPLDDETKVERMGLARRKSSTNKFNFWIVGECGTHRLGKIAVATGLWFVGLWLIGMRVLGNTRMWPGGEFEYVPIENLGYGGEPMRHTKLQTLDELLKSLDDLDDEVEDDSLTEEDHFDRFLDEIIEQEQYYNEDISDIILEEILEEAGIVSEV